MNANIYLMMINKQQTGRCLTRKQTAKSKFYSLSGRRKISYVNLYEAFSPLLVWSIDFWLATVAQA